LNRRAEYVQKFVRASLLGAGLLIATNSSRAESEATPLDRAKAARTRRDFATAVSIYHELDAQGSVEGTRFLGVMYLAGVGVEKDQKRACGLFEAAMLRKDPLATQLVGDCYFNGDGRARDYAKSAQLYRLAGERRVAQSYCALGNQYRKGLAVEKNERKAVELCRKGADKGLPGAQTDLGEMYLMG
jgi:TPR repeat protein